MELNPDSEQLVNDAIGKLEEIKKEYQICIQTTQISSNLKILIKNFLENLRSALDYIAVQIHDENYSKSSRVYYPLYFSKKLDFENTIKPWFPDLKRKNNSLYTIFEKNQFYQDRTKNEWMRDFANLVNGNKHRRLSGLRKNKDGIIGFNVGNIHLFTKELRVQEGGNFTINDQKIAGGQVITPFSKNIKADSGINIQKVVWDEIIFDEVKKPILPTLQSIISGTIMIIEQFKKL